MPSLISLLDYALKAIGALKVLTSPENAHLVLTSVREVLCRNLTALTAQLVISAPKRVLTQSSAAQAITVTPVPRPRSPVPEATTATTRPISRKSPVRSITTVSEDLHSQSSVRLKISTLVSTRLKFPPIADLDLRLLINASLVHPTSANLVYQDITPTMLQRAANYAHLATLAMAIPTLLDRHSLRTTRVKGAPRVTTAHLVPMSLLSAVRELTTLRKVKRNLRIANFVLQVRSRTSGVKTVAAFVANSLTLVKAWTFVSALVTIVLTPHKMPHAGARVASISSMKMNSQKETSVT